MKGLRILFYMGIGIFTACGNKGKSLETNTKVLPNINETIYFEPDTLISGSSFMDSQMVDLTTPLENSNPYVRVHYKKQDSKAKGTESSKIPVSAETNGQIALPLDVKAVVVNEKITINEEPNFESKSSTIDHTLFDELLRKYCSISGAVNYKLFKAEEMKLDKYLTYLSDINGLNSYSKEEKMAFWINLYNASTIKMILEYYPVESIRSLFQGKPWDRKFIKSGGKIYSLNEIENEILRKEFHEPRIHFVLNCAAKSCPPLQNRAIGSDNLNQTLERRTSAFIRSDMNKISQNDLVLSPIFDWYGDDFGDVSEYISKYVNINISSNAKISFGNYDWSLNK